MSPPIPTLEDLLSLVAGLGCRVEQRPSLAASLGFSGITTGRTIIIDSSLSAREKKSVLAEEIGHILHAPPESHAVFYSPRFRRLDFDRRSRLAYRVGRDETRARRWAAEFLVPQSAFLEFAQTGPHSLPDWCDYFEVSEWLMLVRFQLTEIRSYPASHANRSLNNKQLQRGEPLW
ncbi:MAG: ImmA/IrrE family metallo-endopeptidase [Clostridia bacterium]|nr:ImmA/IrrE family metallo-endopeptidase [Clostridia bacterium]